MLREGFVLVAVAVAAGMSSALAAASVLRGMLYGVEPRDPAVFAAVSTVLATVALAATWLPARRAARLDPVSALRSE